MGTFHVSSSNHGLSHHSYGWFWFNLPASNLIPFPPSLNIVCNQSPRGNFTLRFPMWHCFMCTSLWVTCTYVHTHNADHSARTWMYKAKYSRTSTNTVTSKAVCTVAVPFRVSRACGERSSNREKVTRISWQQPAALPVLWAGVPGAMGRRASHKETTPLGAAGASGWLRAEVQKPPR